jgi:hypothetical protein
MTDFNITMKVREILKTGPKTKEEIISLTKEDDEELGDAVTMLSLIGQVRMSSDGKYHLKGSKWK